MSTSHSATMDEVIDEEMSENEMTENEIKKQAKLNRQFLATDPRRKSPLMASFLSLMPGLGQVYVGYYRRGFTNILIAGSVFTFTVSINGGNPLVPFGILFLMFFELYNIIYASCRATLYNLTLDGVEQVELPDDLSEGLLKGVQGSFLGGAILIIFGLIALSNTALGFSLEWLEEWWPLAPLALGIYLVYKAYEESQASPHNENKEVTAEESAD